MSNNDFIRIESIEGEVKWFDPRKGFGFIVGPDGQDIFAHYSVIAGDGFRVLRDGSKVNYDAERTDKGWKATRVERIEEEPALVEVQPGVTATGFARSPRREAPRDRVAEPAHAPSGHAGG